MEKPQKMDRRTSYTRQSIKDIFKDFLSDTPSVLTFEQAEAVFYFSLIHDRREEVLSDYFV